MRLGGAEGAETVVAEGRAEAVDGGEAKVAWAEVVAVAAGDASDTADGAETTVLALLLVMVLLLLLLLVLVMERRAEVATEVSEMTAGVAVAKTAEAGEAEVTVVVGDGGDMADSTDPDGAEVKRSRWGAASHKSRRRHQSSSANQPGYSLKLLTYSSSPITTLDLLSGVLCSSSSGRVLFEAVCGIPMSAVSLLMIRMGPLQSLRRRHTMIPSPGDTINLASQVEFKDAKE
ncbi:hypothetical protein F5148DRAFT_1370976 [Russula earlei]|uniref:Uncharacterized protein n=1 Tax=Russula earlei TaxID=71964 RepID=A0ACC0TUH1_9AGAM|nr:hypothetical protein F5148DRAFT_1370976 [Russula earlei]